MRQNNTLAEILHVSWVFILGTRLIFRYNLLTSILYFPGYIGEFEEVDDHRSGKIVIQLNGRFVDLHSSNRKLFILTLFRIVSTRPVLLAPTITSSCVILRNGLSDCCRLVSSASSFSPPLPVSWTMRRPDESTSLARFLAFSTSLIDISHTAPSTQSE